MTAPFGRTELLPRHKQRLSRSEPRTIFGSTIHFRFGLLLTRNRHRSGNSPTLHKVAAARERPISYAATCVRARLRIGVLTPSVRARATMSPRMCSPSVVEPRSMSRSIDHFSGDPTVVIRVVLNSIKAGRGLKPDAVATAQHSSKILRAYRLFNYLINVLLQARV
jgi:hypothetical protein